MIAGSCVTGLGVSAAPTLRVDENVVGEVVARVMDAVGGR